MMESHCHIMLRLTIFFCSTLFAAGLNGTDKKDRTCIPQREPGLYIACFIGGFLTSLAVVIVILLIKKRLCGEPEQYAINEISGMTPNGFLASGTDNAQGDIQASAENVLEIADTSKPIIKSRRRSSFRQSSIKAKTDAMNRLETAKPIDMITNPISVPPEKTYKENYVSSDKLKRHGCCLKDETIYENVKRPGTNMKPYSADPRFVVIS